ncbi:hypothetical protein HY988_04300 [Candidatus Micrarchaeota archaeon]|nr:hypothetical protein [Candidatus Micrarchaeota archaeon]
MLFINKTIRKGEPVLSKPWASVTFQMPNLYLAESIPDFNRNRLSTKPTPWYRLLNPGRALKGQALILLTSCSYRKISEPDVKKIEAEAVQKQNEAFANYRHRVARAWTDYERHLAGRELDYEMWKIEIFVAHSSRNAELYRPGTESEEVIPIRSSFDIPDNTFLRILQLEFNPKLDFARLGPCITPNDSYPRRPAGTGKSVTLLETILNIFPVPDFSPEPVV